MSLKSLITTLLCVMPYFLFAQSAPNYVNSNNKKEGEWIVYLDGNWKEVSDSSKAKFFRYTTYDNGVDLYPMGVCGKKGWKLVVTETAQIKPSTDPKMLNGVYKWYDASDNLVSEHVFENSEYLDCKEYYPNGVLRHHFDYSNSFQNEVNTYLVMVYSKTGKKTTYVMRNGDMGWLLYLMD